MVKGVIGFVVGAVVSAVILYFAVVPNLQAQNKQLSAQLQQVGSLQSQVQSLTAQRDTCVGRFERVTFLYDVGLLGGEIRAWAIPADVNPQIFGIKRGTFSHYDPKTQTETVHLSPAVVR
jgi:hypothetical protein